MLGITEQISLKQIAVENFPRTFSRAPKLQKTHRQIITANTQGFTWKPEREKPQERDSTQIRRSYK